MAKKRVYELAKDLGLSNKEMVDWLKAHEYDVKSHSSSLEDDQALAVTEKFRGERAPKAAAPKASASGVVLRRKKADTLGPDGQRSAPSRSALPSPSPLGRRRLPPRSPRPPPGPSSPSAGRKAPPPFPHPFLHPPQPPPGPSP